ncbi:MAG: hypothetical protein ACI9XC_001795 [Gammaproteobacteria bacterium]|jgi:uncharacterized protein (TIGR02001 family)
MKTLVNVILTSVIAISPILGFAQDSPHTVSGNVTMASDYLFRGQSQTDNSPAIQGGFDYSHELGLYLGTWASNISFTDDAAEFDFYGGYAGELDNGLGYDLFAVYYYYPGTTSTDAGEDYMEFGPSVSYTFGGDFEPSIGAGFLWSDNFSFNSGTSFYTYGDLGLTLPNDFGLGFHVGHQSIKDEAAWGTPDWLEYNVSLSKNIMGVDLAVTFSDTDLSEAECFGGGNICDSTVVLSISGGW